MLNRDDVELTRAVERCEVPNDGFPHRSHLRVAWVYLHETDTVDDAMHRMSATLRRFATRVGTPDKYSEPTTRFWMLQLAAARAALPAATLDAVLRAYPRLLDTHLIRTDAAHVIAPGSADPSSDAPHRPLPGRSA
jgi:hypothetical protein